jgi:hypothetical protein
VLSTHVNISLYSHYLWINSSVRGPFLPGYLRGAMHWATPLLSRIDQKTKLVGPTINCGGAHGEPPRPHIQSYVVATDRIGLDILFKAGVFDCHADFKDAVLKGEIAASTAILNAGYGIDCLMLRYQGVDWAEATKTAVAGRPCNGGMNPLQPGFNDGESITPLEVLFVKVKASAREAGWTHAESAAKMDVWLAAAENEQQQQQKIGSLRTQAHIEANAWLEVGAPAAERAARARASIDPTCFDWQFYIAANRNDIGFYADLSDPAGAALNQFLNMGVHEGRPHRWTC